VSLFTDIRDTIEGQIVNQFTIGIPLPGPGVIVPTGTTIIGQNIIGDLPAWSTKLSRYISAAEQAALNNLSGAAKVAYAASLGLAAVQVGGATAGNIAANVVQGDPLTKNAGIAAGADVLGLAVGAGIAATGFVDAAAGASAAPEISAAADLPVVDLSASAAPEVGTVDLTTGASSAISPVSSVAVDAAATAPSSSSLAQLVGAGKAAIGAAGTVSGLLRLVNPPKPPIATPRPVITPVPAPAPAAGPACNVCGVGRALLAIAPLAAIAFS
jgi:hypothetical protein